MANDSQKKFADRLTGKSPQMIIQDEIASNPYAIYKMPEFHLGQPTLTSSSSSDSYDQASLNLEDIQKVIRAMEVIPTRPPSEVHKMKMAQIQAQKEFERAKKISATLMLQIKDRPTPMALQVLRKTYDRFKYLQDQTNLDPSIPDKIMDHDMKIRIDQNNRDESGASIAKNLDLFS
jgi:hypothetical protein